MARVVKYTLRQCLYASEVKKVRIKVVRVSWYSQSLSMPCSCWISGSSAGGTSNMPHAAPEKACTQASIPAPRPILSSTGTIVSESTVPRHLVHSHNALGSYSQMIGRFASSATAHCVSLSSCPAFQPGAEGLPSSARRGS
eukprot:926180-Rhodomonas_salina.1